MRFLAIIATTVWVFSGPAFADGTTKEKSPSIVYYGDGTNNQLSQGIFWEGQQGRFADEAQRQKKSGNYRGPALGYGEISAITGQPRTNFVSGYTKSNGITVRPYYRSKR